MDEKMLNGKIEIDLGGGTVEVPMVMTELTVHDNGKVFLTGQELTYSTIDHGYITCVKTPDLDELFKQAMLECSERVHSDERDHIYFSKDGSLTLMCHLSSGNEIRMMVTGDGDVNSASDIAIRVLEGMKTRIDEIQTKVFELSLKQK